GDTAAVLEALDAPLRAQAELLLAWGADLPETPMASLAAETAGCLRNLRLLNHHREIAHVVEMAAPTVRGRNPVGRLGPASPAPGRARRTGPTRLSEGRPADRGGSSRCRGGWPSGNSRATRP